MQPLELEKKALLYTQCSRNFINVMLTNVYMYRCSPMCACTDVSKCGHVQMLANVDMCRC